MIIRSKISMLKKGTKELKNNERKGTLESLKLVKRERWMAWRKRLKIILQGHLLWLVVLWLEVKEVRALTSWRIGALLILNLLIQRRGSRVTTRERMFPM
jgi:hypothetical protein